ncbi:hypothetical protein SAMN04244553_1341 [Nocardia amikacinitolerans]|uniref:Uncharacterized protein n=1 Tax=Nocardia amikacinitolerans TaxID=756689 RepID=A0A285L5F1_9NOCA|nr:hypothetical protein [Nocardia amikacinitolerans]SNY78621.1 hypothetical protein SAMN04244553_1341 [Nocardia amikacinitolerans]
MTSPESAHFGARLGDIEALRTQARLSVRRRDPAGAVRDLHRAGAIAEELVRDAQTRTPRDAEVLRVLVRVIELEGEIARAIDARSLAIDDVGALSAALAEFSARPCGHGVLSVGGDCGPGCGR